MCVCLRVEETVIKKIMECREREKEMLGGR